MLAGKNPNRLYNPALSVARGLLFTQTNMWKEKSNHKLSSFSFETKARRTTETLKFNQCTSPLLILWTVGGKKINLVREQIVSFQPLYRVFETKWVSETWGANEAALRFTQLIVFTLLLLALQCKLDDELNRNCLKHTVLYVIMFSTVIRH